MVFVFHREVLPATGVTACAWARLKKAEALFVVQSSWVAVYEVTHVGRLRITSRIDMCAAIDDVAACAYGECDDLMAFSFGVKRRLCICRIDVDDECAVPVYTHDFMGCAQHSTVHERSIDDAHKRLRLSAAAGVVAVLAGRQFAVVAESLRDASLQYQFRHMELRYHARLTVVDFELVRTNDLFAPGSCSLVVAFGDAKSQNSTSICCFDVDVSDRRFTKVWDAVSPGSCLKMLVISVHEVCIFSCNRITKVGKQGQLSTSLQMNSHASSESQGLISQLSIEFDAHVEATLLGDKHVCVFTHNSLWMYDACANVFAPVARLPSINVSSVAVSSDTNLMFLGSTTTDSVLLHYAICEKGSSNRSQELVRSSCVGSLCCPISTWTEFIVWDSLCSLGTIVDATLSIRRNTPDGAVLEEQLRPAPELVACCTSGNVVLLSSKLELHSMARVTRVSSVVGTAEDVIIETSYQSLRRFHVGESGITEVEIKDNITGRPLAGCNGVIVCNNSVSRISLVSASACDGVIMARSTCGHIYELMPQFRLRGNDRYDAVSLTKVPPDVFYPHVCRAYPERALKALKTNERCDVTCTFESSAEAQSLFLHATRVVCVCARCNGGEIVLYDSLSWTVIYKSKAHLSSKPRWLCNNDREIASGQRTNDVKLHYFKDGGCGLWCLAALVGHNLCLFRKTNKGFRRLSIRDVEGCTLASYESQGHSGLFVSSQSSGAVVLAVRGTIRVIDTSYPVAVSVQSIYGWMSCGCLHFSSDFRKFLLSEGDVCVRKVSLGTTVGRGCKIVLCSSDAPPSFAVLVETRSQNHAPGMLPCMSHSHSRGLHTSISNVLEGGSMRHEIRIVAAERVRHSCVLAEHESGIALSILSVHRSKYLCVGTHKSQYDSERVRPRGRILLFKYIQSQLKCAVVREMPGIVSCVKQLGGDYLVAAVGPKLEIHQLYDDNGTLTLRQVAHHHTCGHYVTNLVCFKQYILYSSHLGVRLLFWRSRDKLVAEIGKHEKPVSTLGFIAYQSEFLAVMCSRTRAVVASGTALLQNRKSVSYECCDTFNVSAPIASCTPYVLNACVSALAMCCFDGSVFASVAMDESTFRILAALERGICCGASTEISRNSFTMHHASLVRTVANLPTAFQIHLAMAVLGRKSIEDKTARQMCDFGEVGEASLSALSLLRGSFHDVMHCGLFADTA